ncbi:MAG: AAA family ATPase [Christensenellaceae bacterium]|jgi:hypothetical protein|nr:AAA family ATPase [Christensenellaceae bacterium]
MAMGGVPRLCGGTFFTQLLLSKKPTVSQRQRAQDKTTIAKVIAADEGLTFEQGKSFEAYSVLVYNQDFIDRTLQSYRNLPGVYTIGEENVEIQNRIEKATQEKDEIDARLKTDTDERERKETAKDTLLTSFQSACWDRTKTERDEFAETQVGKKQKATFADEILRTATPTQHDLAALRSLYETAYDPDARAYGGFTLLGGVTRLKNSNGNALMSKVISNSGDSRLPSL